MHSHCTEKQDNLINFDKWQPYEEAYINVLTMSELLIGVHRADTQARRLKRSAFVEAIIN